MATMTISPAPAATVTVEDTAWLDLTDRQYALADRLGDLLERDRRASYSARELAKLTDAKFREVRTVLAWMVRQEYARVEDGGLCSRYGVFRGDV